jgi:transposase
MGLDLPTRKDKSPQGCVRKKSAAFCHSSPKGIEMAYRIAAIDIHKKVLMAVVATAADEVKDPTGQALEFECRRFGTLESDRRELIQWLLEREVQEVVMESTALYWRPIWLDMEGKFGKLHLAQAQSNRAPKGRKTDYKDAKRLARRLLAGELMLSYVPEAEQRSWRDAARAKDHYVAERVQLHNRVEALLEEMRIKLSSVISNLFGLSGRSILAALAEGKITDPEELAALGDRRLACSKEKLADALRGSPRPIHRQILAIHLQALQQYDDAIRKLDQLVAEQLQQHQEAVARLLEIPGFSVDSAQRFIAEVGVGAEAFPSAEEFGSWFGGCPGSNITAEQNHSGKSPKGNVYVRKLLTQAAQAAVRTKGSRFQALFQKFVPKQTYPGAIWTVAHRLGKVAWKILHDGVRYIEYGEQSTPSVVKRRVRKYSRALRKLGYQVTLVPLTNSTLGAPSPA